MEETNYRPVTTGNWMLTILLMCIPLVNLVLLCVWAFGSNTPVSKANWAKASLIWMGIALASYVVLLMLIAVLGLGAGSSLHCLQGRDTTE